jgi:uncharacterized membrane protein YeaQ/YmgE (transglycosylase-associated protein family)
LGPLLIKRGIRVIPVLVEGALMPQSGQLPEDLKALALRNALNVSHDRFRPDAERLIGAVERALERAKAENQSPGPAKDNNISKSPKSDVLAGPERGDQAPHRTWKSASDEKAGTSKSQIPGRGQLHLLWPIVVGLLAGFAFKMVLHPHGDLIPVVLITIVGSLLGWLLPRLGGKPNQRAQISSARVLSAFLGATLVLLILLILHYLGII